MAAQSQRTIAVVGGGLAGLMTTMKLAEAGHKVKLFSLVPVKRSHSVCAQGGINGAVNLRGEGDSPYLHFEDTITGGDFLTSEQMLAITQEMRHFESIFLKPTETAARFRARVFAISASK